MTLRPPTEDQEVYGDGVESSFLARGIPRYMAGAHWPGLDLAASLALLDRFTPRTREEIPIWLE